MEKHNLKPCPFCGGRAEFNTRSWGFTKTVCVECVKCNASAAAYEISTDYCAKDSAADAWNKRTTE